MQVKDEHIAKQRTAAVTCSIINDFEGDNLTCDNYQHSHNAEPHKMRKKAL
jgi:hypothetical protein